MDWYNPAYWAHHQGAYSAWRSIYPPISYVMLKLLSVPGCYVTSSFAARDCDMVGIAAILLLYAAAMAASYVALRQHQPQAALLRTLALAFGYPGLFALERGNLLIACYTAFVFAVVPIAANRWANRWARPLAAGIMINFKPYMLVPAMAWAIRRQWRLLELAGFATVAIYLASWAVVGSGSVLELLENAMNWVQFTTADQLGEVYYTTSFNSLFGVVDRGFPVLHFVPSQSWELFRLTTMTAMRVAQVAGVIALLAAWLQPRAVTEARLVLILMLLSLTNRSPGGYTELFVVFLAFLEPWRGPGPIIAIVTAYLISLPCDWIVTYLPDAHTSAWLSGQAVTGRFGIAVGQLARPMGLLLMLFCLALDTLVQATRGHRFQPPSLGLLVARRALP